VSVIEDPSSAQLPPRLAALAAMAAVVADAPWALDDGHLEALRAVGLDDAAVAQAVGLAAAFSHLVRVAEATRVDLDYESLLPRLKIDADREAPPRPPRQAWPKVRVRVALAPAPAWMAPLQALRAQVFEASAALPAQDRALLARTAAFELCDGASLEELGGPSAHRTERDRALSTFATKLTRTPWRMTEDDLAPLRSLGLADDRDLFHAIAVVGYENVASRLRLALGWPVASGG
jgi:alkylhydroperoxidase family enzyme